MSLVEHRSSPSTVQFIYSPQPRSTNPLRNISTVVDFITSLFQSSLIVLLVQWSTNHFRTNRIIGPLLQYLRYLLPYNDIRILKTSDNKWEITPLGIIAIICLAIFLSFSKRMPIGSLSFYVTDNRGIVLDYEEFRSTDHDAYAVSISESFTIYSRITNR